MKQLLIIQTPWMLTGDELRKVQRCEEKSEEINNELEFKKEKVEWDNLIILKNKVKELNKIEKIVFLNICSHKKKLQIWLKWRDVQGELCKE